MAMAMDADTAALDRFTDVPFVIEAPADKGAMVGAAAAAMARPGLRVRSEPRPGLPDSKYRDMVERIRHEIETQLTPKPGYQVRLYDASAPMANVELGKIHASMKPQEKSLNALMAAKGAFSGLFKLPDARVTCLVVGFRPNVNVDMFLWGSTGIRNVPRAGLDDATFHSMTMLHEVGHCLLGGSEAKSDAFAALMALRDPGVTREAIAHWATWRESAEWAHPQTDDDHYTSKGVWEVLERADALRADPAFQAMPMDGVAGLANALVDARGLGEEQEAEMASVRRAMRAGVKLVDPGFKDMPGLDPLVPWLERNDGIPEIARILDLHANLVQGAHPMEPFAMVPGAFRKSLGELAATGDRVANAMVRAYDTPPNAHSHGALEAKAMHTATSKVAMPYTFKVTDYDARVIAYDPSCGVTLAGDGLVTSVSSSPDRDFRRQAIPLGDARGAEPEEEEAPAFAFR